MKHIAQYVIEIICTNVVYFVLQYFMCQSYIICNMH